LGRYYRDVKQMYEIYGSFLDRVLRHETIGPKMGSARIVVQFIYTDPDGEITIDLKNPPAEPGTHGTFYLGPCEVKADVWSRQSADHSHRFWHGLENPIASVARGRVKQGGNVVAMLKLLPVVRRAFEMFPVVLRELEYDDLVLTRDRS
jgi:hypothetical protein